jgi:hypothetical protein
LTLERHEGDRPFPFRSRQRYHPIPTAIARDNCRQGIRGRFPVGFYVTPKAFYYEKLQFLNDPAAIACATT